MGPGGDDDRYERRPSPEDAERAERGEGRAPADPGEVTPWPLGRLTELSGRVAVTPPIHT